MVIIYKTDDLVAFNELETCCQNERFERFFSIHVTIVRSDVIIKRKIFANSFRSIYGTVTLRLGKKHSLTHFPQTFPTRFGKKNQWIRFGSDNKLVFHRCEAANNAAMKQAQVLNNKTDKIHILSFILYYYYSKLETLLVMILKKVTVRWSKLSGRRNRNLCEYLGN